MAKKFLSVPYVHRHTEFLGWRRKLRLKDLKVIMCVDLNKIILSDTTHTLATLISSIQRLNASEKPNASWSLSPM